MFDYIYRSGFGQDTITATRLSESPSFRATQRVLDEQCRKVSSDCANCQSKCACECDESFNTGSFPFGRDWGYTSTTDGLGISH